MKGIVLAGGNGRRMEPITKVTNKHLLGVYDKPMIYYPVQTLINAGIKDIMVITGREHAGTFVRLLGSGKQFGVNFSFEFQDEAGGIAQALAMAEDFVDGCCCAVILGDNIFEDDFSKQIKGFEGGAHIFLKEVHDPGRFGVPELDGDKVLAIEEKPENPKTNYAVTGLYLYDNAVFDIIKTLKPSARGEMEITDVNNHYIKNASMKASQVKGEWTDAGTFESLYAANRIARNIALSKQD
jgi:glucose-1-phosphate thymidylyltransferase